MKCDFDRSAILPSPSGYCLVPITARFDHQLSGLSGHAHLMQFREGLEEQIVPADLYLESGPLLFKDWPLKRD